jgi:hypothetical protein
MSRLEDNLDSHKDGEVRRALEPLAGVADKTRMAVLGLIHHNKGGSTDPLQLVMASKAFTAVARSVHTVVPDPDDDTDTRRVFGTSKNNLGRANLPSLTFTVNEYSCGATNSRPASPRRCAAPPTSAKTAKAQPNAPTGYATTSPAKAARHRAPTSRKPPTRTATATRPSAQPANGYGSQHPATATRGSPRGTCPPTQPRVKILSVVTSVVTPLLGETS